MKRVRRALEDAGVPVDIREMSEGTRTADDAARAVACEIDQIAKSIIFHDPAADAIVLFVTAGGNRVDPAKAADVAGVDLERADAGVVRRLTGFAIGGVAPVGHITAPRAFYDARLLDFDVVWAAAGTPRHVFPINPDRLQQISGAQIADFTA